MLLGKSNSSEESVPFYKIATEKCGVEFSMIESKIFDLLLKNVNLCHLSDAWDVHLVPEDYSAHDVANALRRFLRSFDDCLLTQRLYESWIKCSREYSCYSLKYIIKKNMTLLSWMVEMTRQVIILQYVFVFYLFFILYSLSS